MSNSQETMLVQPVRTIQVYDSRSSRLINLQTNESQWSNIIPLITAEGINMTNVKAVVGSTKGTLELPDALIPAGNQQIILAVSKMSSGVVDKDFADLKYNDLRREAKTLGIEGLGSNPTRDQIISAIKSHTGLNEKATTKVAKTERATKVEAIKTEAKSSEPSLEERVSAMEDTVGKLIHGIYGVTVSFLGKKEVETPITPTTFKSNEFMTVEELEKLARTFKAK